MTYGAKLPKPKHIYKLCQDQEISVVLDTYYGNQLFIDDRSSKFDEYKILGAVKFCLKRFTLYLHKNAPSM